MLLRARSRRFILSLPELGAPKQILLLLAVLITFTGYGAPPLTASFTGIPQTGFSPPDPVIAAGPSHVVAVVNSTFTIYDKVGNSVFTRALSTWFNPVGPPGTPFDPKIIYDPKGGHWVMLALASGNPRRSSYLLSVSSNSSPVGIWWLYNLDAGLDQGAASGNTANSCGLGYDSDEAIYLTSNQYDSHDVFQYAKLRIIPKSRLYSGMAASWWDFWNQTDANGLAVFGWKPAQAQSTISGNYLIGTRPGGSNYVTLWKVTNPLNTSPGPTLTRQATLSVQPYVPATDALQSGNGISLNTGDCRAQEVLFQNGKLVTAWTEGYNWGNGPVSAIRTLVLDAGDSVVNIDNRFGADKAWYFYPAVVRDPAGNMAMVFNRSSSNEFAGAHYSAWLAGESNWETPAALKAGEGSYGSSLWGNHTGAAVDPTDSSRAWLFGEYAASGNQWGTWIGQIQFPNLTNDLCNGAINLTNSVTYTLATGSATGTNDPALICDVLVDKGVWFGFTPSATAPLLITTCGSDFPTVLQVYTGNCAALTPLICNSGNGPGCSSSQASVRFDGTAGTRYLIYVGGNGAASGNLEITAYSPANDSCVGAIALNPGVPYFMNTAAAGSTGDPAPNCGSGVSKSVWFSYTATTDAAMLVTTCGSDFDTVLQIYSGTCDSKFALACNNDNGPGCTASQASATFLASAGTTYLFNVGGAAGASGNLAISVSLLNDTCAGAFPLFLNGINLENTASAGSVGDPPDVCGFSAGKGVWFSFTPPGNGRLTLTTCGSSFPTALQVYEGNCGFLSEVTCNAFSDPDCSTPGSTSVQFDAFLGTSYLIFAGGVSGAGGTLVISNNFCQPPVMVGGITNSVLTPTGILVSATVFLQGTPPFDISWSDGPLSTNTGSNPSVTFLIPLESIVDFLTESNFSTIRVSVLNGCGQDGGSGGFPSPCVVCLSRGVPITSSTTSTASGTGPNLPTSCGSVGFSARWYDMAAADSGMADVSVMQSTPSDCQVSVFAGTLPSVTAITCYRTTTNRETRLQFAANTNQHYYLVVTNAGIVTNMTYGFIPQLVASRSNGRVDFTTSGIGPPLTYTLQTSPTVLPPAWSNLFSTTSPGAIFYSDTTVTNVSQRFYRIAPGP